MPQRGGGGASERRPVAGGQEASTRGKKQVSFSLVFGKHQ